MNAEQVLREINEEQSEPAGLFGVGSGQAYTYANGVMVKESGDELVVNFSRRELSFTVTAKTARVILDIVDLVVHRHQKREAELKVYKRLDAVLERVGEKPYITDRYHEVRANADSYIHGYVAADKKNELRPYMKVVVSELEKEGFIVTDTKVNGLYFYVDFEDKVY